MFIFLSPSSSSPRFFFDGLAGQHAESVFRELFHEANVFCARANSLQDRIDRLAVKVTQLDSGEEEGQCQSVRVFSPGSSVSVPNVCCGSVSLRVINLRKAFRSSTLQDQQLLSNGSMTDAVADLYNSSDRPPPLNTLTVYRYHTHQQGSPQHPSGQGGRIDTNNHSHRRSCF